MGIRRRERGCGENIRIIISGRFTCPETIISTDPAHNLSDAFNQKMSYQPTLINGFNNLYGIEINPKELKDEDDNLTSMLGISIDEETQNIFEDLKNSIPGIDEALAIGVLLQIIDKMDYSIVIFDTAPTGHTLRIKNVEFPSNIRRGVKKIFDVER